MLLATSLSTAVIAAEPSECSDIDKVIVLSVRRHFPEAVDAGEHYVQAHGIDKRILMELGGVHYALGDYAASLNHFARALKAPIQCASYRTQGIQFLDHSIHIYLSIIYSELGLRSKCRDEIALARNSLGIYSGINLDSNFHQLGSSFLTYKILDANAREDQLKALACWQ